jgi:site-specific recombinase XerD
LEHARTLQAAADAWITHLAATGTKASSIGAYRAALDNWFMATLKGRSLDRITTSDMERAMRQMRDAGLSDKSIRNYVGVIRALYNFAIDKRRRWAARNPQPTSTCRRSPPTRRSATSRLMRCGRSLTPRFPARITSWTRRCA